ncbi:hypothetical protein D9X30_4488 [Cupriavidus sp. U2]|nr:hypothetical protein D9X30_4488 [Cupriavidus sp. U2]
MNANTIEQIGLTVDELIIALQSVSGKGHGNLPAHALMGDHTGPICGVDVVPGWGDAETPVALMMAHDDSEEGSNVQSAPGALCSQHEPYR